MQRIVQNALGSTLALCAMAATSLAQTSDITGRVADSSGAVVPGAAISVTNT